jgi:2-polyprenyl-6-methoxyphenol hydroxylase-like FAD-dependent oxidoreductase
VFGRIALVGDAAFVVRPHAGADTTKAALDAACLADALSVHGVDEGLSHYQREQLRFGRSLIALCRYEGDHLSGQIKRRAGHNEPERQWDPERVLSGYVTRSAEVARVYAQRAG